MIPQIIISLTVSGGSLFDKKLESTFWQVRMQPQADIRGTSGELECVVAVTFQSAGGHVGEAAEEHRNEAIWRTGRFIRHTYEPDTIWERRDMLKKNLPFEEHEPVNKTAMWPFRFVRKCVLACERTRICCTVFWSSCGQRVIRFDPASR